jgi:carbon storage regulator
MLVLSRHRYESIRVGDDVVITLFEIRGDKIRIGVEAPPEVPIHRQEVYDAILRGNEGRRLTDPQPPKLPLFDYTDRSRVRVVHDLSILDGERLIVVVDEGSGSCEWVWYRGEHIVDYSDDGWGDAAVALRDGLNSALDDQVAGGAA